MVVYDAESKIYHFGPKIWELSMAYYHRIHLVPVAWPYLQRLRALLNELSGELQHIGHVISTRVGSAEPDAWRKLPSLSLPIRASLL